MYSLHSVSMYTGCTWIGVQYEEGATWTDARQTCSCAGGQVSCRTDDCPDQPNAPCPPFPQVRERKCERQGEKHRSTVPNPNELDLCLHTVHRPTIYIHYYLVRQHPSQILTDLNHSERKTFRV